MEKEADRAALKHAHDRAMALADAAQHEQGEDRRMSLQQAAVWESLAAGRATTLLDRAVLYRSAATLALEAGWPERARELAQRGLEGEPPAAIAEELRAVLSRCGV